MKRGLNVGLEFEYFVGHRQKSGETLIIPAYLKTNNLDGSKMIGELRTGVHSKIADAVFELTKLIYLEEKKLEKKNCKLVFDTTEFKFDSIQMREARRDNPTKKFDVEPEFSIYPKGKIGKILPHGTFKIAFQINLSMNNYVTSRSSYEHKTTEVTEHWYAENFNYVDMIAQLDTKFAEYISAAKRVKGVYAIKEGRYGKRIEYRSLPSSVPGLELLDFMREMKKPIK